MLARLLDQDVDEVLKAERRSHFDTARKEIELLPEPHAERMMHQFPDEAMRNPKRSFKAILRLWL